MPGFVLLELFRVVSSDVETSGVRHPLVDGDDLAVVTSVHSEQAFKKSLQARDNIDELELRVSPRVGVVDLDLEVWMQINCVQELDEAVGADAVDQEIDRDSALSRFLEREVEALTQRVLGEDVHLESDQALGPIDVLEDVCVELVSVEEELLIVPQRGKPLAAQDVGGKIGHRSVILAHNCAPECLSDFLFSLIHLHSQTLSPDTVKKGSLCR